MLLRGVEVKREISVRAWTKLPVTLPEPGLPTANVTSLLTTLQLSDWLMEKVLKRWSA